MTRKSGLDSVSYDGSYAYHSTYNMQLYRFILFDILQHLHVYWLTSNASRNIIIIQLLWYAIASHNKHGTDWFVTYS